MSKTLTAEDDLLLNKIIDEKGLFYSHSEEETIKEIIVDFHKAKVESELIDFGVWYSGMEKQKVSNSYKRYLKEQKLLEQ